MEKMHILSEYLTRLAMYFYYPYIIATLYLAYVIAVDLYDTYGFISLSDELFKLTLSLVLFVLALLPLIVINEARFFGRLWRYQLVIIFIHYGLGFLIFKFYYNMFVDIGRIEFSFPYSVSTILFGVTPILLILSGIIRSFIYYVKSR